MMRHALFALVLLSPAFQAAAQVTAPAAPPAFDMPMADDPPSGAPGAGRPGSQQGTGRESDREISPLDDLLDNMLRRAQPHLEGLARDMGGLFNEYEPVLRELSGLMDDIANYEMPPERLPNGDILIRRKAGAPPPPPLDELPGLLPDGADRPDATPPGNLRVTPGEQVDL